jgi:hypothetical protein
MSLKDVEVKLKTLGMKNDTAALEAFVSSLEDEKVILIIFGNDLCNTLFTISVLRYRLV